MTTSKTTQTWLATRGLASSASTARGGGLRMAARCHPLPTPCTATRTGQKASQKVAVVTAFRCRLTVGVGVQLTVQRTRGGTSSVTASLRHHHHRRHRHRRRHRRRHHCRRQRQARRANARARARTRARARASARTRARASASARASGRARASGAVAAVGRADLLGAALGRPGCQAEGGALEGNPNPSPRPHPNTSPSPNPSPKPSPNLSPNPNPNPNPSLSLSRRSRVGCARWAAILELGWG